MKSYNVSSRFAVRPRHRSCKPNSRRHIRPQDRDLRHVLLHAVTGQRSHPLCAERLAGGVITVLLRGSRLQTPSCHFGATRAPESLPPAKPPSMPPSQLLPPPPAVRLSTHPLYRTTPPLCLPLLLLPPPFRPLAPSLPPALPFDGRHGLVGASPLGVRRRAGGGCHHGRRAGNDCHRSLHDDDRVGRRVS